MWRLRIHAQSRDTELEMMGGFFDDLPVPSKIAVESPVVAGSRNLRTALDMAMTAGAVVAGARRAGAEVHLVPPALWKKTVVGKGNATKEEVAAFVRSADSRFAAAAEGDQDLVDAFCISRWCQAQASGLDG